MGKGKCSKEEAEWIEQDEKAIEQADEIEILKERLHEKDEIIARLGRQVDILATENERLKVELNGYIHFEQSCADLLARWKTGPGVCSG